MKLQNLVETKYGENINLSGHDLLELPDDLPQHITGYFYCRLNLLTSLKHCPVEVGDDLRCSYNELTSLEHCSSKVGGNFRCEHNKLTSLRFCPAEVGGAFDCSNNELASLRDIHKQIKRIRGEFWCHDNPIKSHVLGLMLIDIGGEIITHLGNGKDVDEILNRWKNQGRKGVIGAQRESLELGYKELAQV